MNMKDVQNSMEGERRENVGISSKVCEMTKHVHLSGFHIEVCVLWHGATFCTSEKVSHSPHLESRWSPWQQTGNGVRVFTQLSPVTLTIPFFPPVWPLHSSKDKHPVGPRG